MRCPPPRRRPTGDEGRAGPRATAALARKRLSTLTLTPCTSCQPVVGGRLCVCVLRYTVGEPPHPVLLEFLNGVFTFEKMHALGGKDVH